MFSSSKAKAKRFPLISWSDEIYVEAWKAAITECNKQLEPQDRDRALEVKNSDDFRTQ